METLTDLIAQNNIRSTWFYSHSVDAGTGDNRSDYDVFDMLLYIDAGVCLYGGISNQRTLLVREYGVAPANSQPSTGGELRPPTTQGVLANITADAVDVDNAATWQEWAQERYGDGGTFTDGLAAYDRWKATKHQRDELFTFLGSDGGEWSLYARMKRAADLNE